MDDLETTAAESPPPADPPPRRDGLQSAAAVITALLGVAYVLWVARGFLIPFALGGLIAIAFSPLAARIERTRLGAPWVSAVLAFLMLGGIVGIVGTIGYLGVLEVSRAYPEYALQLSELVDELSRAAGVSLEERKKLSGDMVLSSQSFALLRRVGASSIGFVTGSALTLLFLFFFVVNRQTFARKVHQFLMSQGFAEGESDETLATITTTMTRYIWLKTAISAVTGLLFGLAAWVGGTPFPVFWGFIAFSFNYAPSVGPIIAAVVPIILTLLVVKPLGVAVGLSLVLGAIQLISGSMIEPKILGDELDLNIVTAFLALLFWGLVWGPVGMLLGIPLTAMIQLILRCSRRAAPIAELMGS